MDSLIIVLMILIMLSAFFSGTETAFSSVNKIRLKNLANEGNKKAKLALRIEDDYDTLLSTLLVGNNIVNIMATAIATVLFTKQYGDVGATISTVVMTITVLIFGEVTPKSLAKENPEAFSMFAARYVLILEYVLAPINFFFKIWKLLVNKFFNVQSDDSFSQEELITIVEEAENDGDLEAHESDLIRAAIEFNDLEVKEIFTPRVDVLAVDVEDTMDEIEEVFRENRFSRIPVYENSIDNIIGIIHEKDFYHAFYTKQLSIEDIIKPIQFTSSYIKISALLKQLQTNKSHMAVVLDEYGGTAGIITMEDILEELVGEIYDEHDEIKEFVQKIDDNTYIIEGEFEVDDFFDIFDLKEDEECEANTVAGWITRKLDKIPQVDDNFEYENLSITVIDADERKVNKVKVEKIAEKVEE